MISDKKKLIIIAAFIVFLTIFFTCLTVIYIKNETYIDICGLTRKTVNKSLVKENYQKYYFASDEYYEILFAKYGKMNTEEEQKKISEMLIKKADEYEKDGLFKDYRLCDLFLTNMLSFMRYTNNKKSFYAVYKRAHEISSKYSDEAKSVIIPEVLEEIKTGIESDKKFKETEQI